MSVTEGQIRGKYHQDINVPRSNPAISQIHKYIDRHTADTIVSWPNPNRKQRLHVCKWMTCTFMYEFNSIRFKLALLASAPLFNDGVCHNKTWLKSIQIMTWYMRLPIQYLNQWCHFPNMVTSHAPQQISAEIYEGFVIIYTTPF